MATKIGSLFGDVSLRTAQLDKDITKVGKMLCKMGNNMKSLGKDLSAKVTAPIIGIGVASLKAFGDFEAGMNEVKSLMPDLNQGEFVSLKNDVRALAVEMGVNVVESTKALYQAISAGVPRENAIEFLRVASQSAIAGVTDVETSVDTLTSVLNAYKRSAEDAEDVADVLFTTVRLGKTNFEELGSSIFNVAPLAAAMNIPLEEISAAVATLTKQGVPTAQAMTQIRASLVALQKPNADMVTALGNLGFASGQALLDAKGYQGALEALRSESGLAAAELTKAFGRVEAFGAVLSLTGENFSGAIDDLRAVTNSANSMFEAFKANNESLWRSLQQLGSALREVGIQLGEQFAPYISRGAELFKEWYTANIASIPGWVELGAKIAAVTAVVGPLLIVMGSVVSTIATLVPLVKVIAVALAALGGPVLGAVLVATGILLLLWDEAWAFGENYLGPFLVWLINTFEKVTSAIADVAAGLRDKLIVGFKAAYQTIRTFIANSIDRLYSKLRALWDFFVQVKNTIGGAISGVFEGGGSIGARASGGPVSSGSPYIVGEQGPELFVPRYSGSIVPNHALGGAGGQTIHMHFAPGIGMDVLAAIKNSKGLIAKMAVDAVREDNLRRV